MKEKAAEKMQELIKVKGLININGMKFHNIEGGFGGNKRSMLAKEIANIHGRDLKDINRNINNNIKRFKKGVDILDLKVGELKPLSLELGYSNQSYANANNIYLLSERGYSKLLKILEDDVAWEQYEKLVDGYFNLREQVTQFKGLSKELQAIFSIDAKQQELETEVKDLKENMPLFNIECEDLQKEVRKIGMRILGGHGSAAYKDNSLRAKLYKDIQNQVKREFGLNSYKAIKRSQLDVAKDIVRSYKTPIVLKEEITMLNNQLSFKEGN
ncbi:ORF6C domain-containing protein [Clostridium sp. HBUAS56017]|uniref:ORF6C domain-containing protein n=1 Tax=Clostridium sp. HBUAS56017 TaxID=2571128 RepID=UPI00117865C5|nr:ORF6C domain-containing protein [Clostridium sp. HBUAS56017]